MILLSLLSKSYDVLMSLSLKWKTTLIIDKVIKDLLGTINKKQLASSSYKVSLATKVYSRASTNTERSISRSRYQSKDDAHQKFL